MKVKILHNISPTERHWFEFEVVGSHINYNGVDVSRRNDESDVWGDEWNAKFAERRAEIAKQMGDLDIHSPSLIQDHADLKKQYDALNPCSVKTNSGKPYYQSVRYGRDLPTPPWTKFEIKELIRIDILSQLAKMEVDL